MIAVNGVRARHWLQSDNLQSVHFAQHFQQDCFLIGKYLVKIALVAVALDSPCARASEMRLYPVVAVWRVYLCACTHPDEAEVAVAVLLKPFLVTFLFK